MKLFGLEISRASKTKALSPPSEGRWSGGWFPVIRESNTGLWQRNQTLTHDTALARDAVWTCVTLIAGDFSKLRMKLIALQPSGIWTETANPAYSPVLRDPNPYQFDHQFLESWVLSKLLWGNTYVLKRRDLRGVVSNLYPLDPSRVKPLIADDGSVFYELLADNLSTVPERVIVPAREIIHDRWNCVFHPLIGLSPLYAAGLSAGIGLEIQRTSDAFFRNRASPSGVMTAPGNIDRDTAERLADEYQENYGGENTGNIMVAGSGLTYQALTMTAVDAQLIEQLKWTAEAIANIFHVPNYKAGLGIMPTQTGIEALNIEYYSQCLQKLFEDFEGALDRGLDLGPTLGLELDLDGLLRMDTTAKVAYLKDAVGAGILKPDEARIRFNLPPTEGGDTPYLQEQNYSLRALAKRDAMDNPFAAKGGPAPAAPPPPAQNDNSAQATQANAALIEIYRGFA